LVFFCKNKNDKYLRTLPLRFLKHVHLIFGIQGSPESQGNVTDEKLKKVYYYYKDLFTHKDINTYINGVVKICLNKFF